MQTQNLSRRGFIKAASVFAGAMLTRQWSFAETAKRKPNIIYIMADDLGYGDLGCYGNKGAHTPNLDKMAAEGMRFTDFHSNGPVCTPTRAALLTGKYQQRVGLYAAPEQERYTQVKTMPLEELTFAELAKLAGYSTGIVGKWHLGDHIPYLATRQGFDEWFGLPYSNDMHPYKSKNQRPPLPLFRGEQIIEMNPNQDYLTTRYTKEAIDFIRRHKETPFVLYLPHNMPHKPIHCSEPFQKRFTQEQLDSIKGHYDSESRQFLYPAVVEEIDHSTGEILKTLKELGLEKDTLVIFSSDNGPQSAGSAGPLKGGKGSMYEGGHRVPGIFYWPGRIKPGQVCHQTATMVDLFPTWANLMGVKIPDFVKTDGIDLTDVLQKNAKLPERTLFWRDRDRVVARRGPWKLMINPNKRDLKTRDDIELYNLDEDLSETKDLAAEKPEIANDLKQQALDWEKTVGPERDPEW